ncbi:MAG: dTMP kinase [Phycisphaeraceae bacterium]|nr:dTMP kinase [Phycisphaeraceae bacterium]
MSSGPATLAWLHALRGRFVVFDGPDGSGKSTQMQRFIALCREHGLPVTDVREPGGTPIGERIRGVLLDPAHTEMTVRCEMLLYMASRAQLVHERIEPALSRGDFVLSDRFVSSTLAYQGTAGGLSEQEIRQVAQVAVGSHMPDLVIIFDVDEVTSARRLSPLLDRMEQKGLDFHRRVRGGYLAQVERDPGHHLVIDASREPDEVFAALVAALGRYAASHWSRAVGHGVR